MVFNINLFLEKFKIITPPDDFIRKTVVDVVKVRTYIEIQKSDVKVEGNVIYIFASSVVKNELYIKKTTLIGDINKIVPIHITDIR